MTATAWPPLADPIAGACVVDGMPDDVYHADPVPEGSLSVSGAKLLLDCPARYTAARAPKKAFDVGHAAHAKILGEGMGVAVIPDEILGANGAASTAKAKAFIAEARASGLVPIKSDEAARIDGMAEAILRHPLAARLLRDGQSEQSMFWRDPQTRVMLRGRVDWLTVSPAGRPTIVDYKTSARSAAPAAFARYAWDFHYEMQDAWYREGALASGLTDSDTAFVFIVQETAAPYLLTVLELDDDARQVGAELNARARRIYLDCRTGDEWPGYAPTIHRVGLPGYAYTQSLPDTDGDPE